MSLFLTFSFYAPASKQTVNDSLSEPKNGKIYGIGENIPGTEASALLSHSRTFFRCFQVTLKTRMCGIYGILSGFFSDELLSLFGVVRNVCRLVYPSRSGLILPVNPAE